MSKRKSDASESESDDVEDVQSGAFENAEDSLDKQASSITNTQSNSSPTSDLIAPPLIITRKREYLDTDIAKNARRKRYDLARDNPEEYIKQLEQKRLRMAEWRARRKNKTPEEIEKILEKAKAKKINRCRKKTPATTTTSSFSATPENSSSAAQPIPVTLPSTSSSSVPPKTYSYSTPPDSETPPATYPSSSPPASEIAHATSSTAVPPLPTTLPASSNLPETPLILPSQEDESVLNDTVPPSSLLPFSSPHQLPSQSQPLEPITSTPSPVLLSGDSSSSTYDLIDVILKVQLRKTELSSLLRNHLSSFKDIVRECFVRMKDDMSEDKFRLEQIIEVFSKKDSESYDLEGVSTTMFGTYRHGLELRQRSFAKVDDHQITTEEFRKWKEKCEMDSLTFPSPTDLYKKYDSLRQCGLKSIWNSKMEIKPTLSSLPISSQSMAQSSDKELLYDMDDTALVDLVSQSEAETGNVNNSNQFAIECIDIIDDDLDETDNESISETANQTVQSNHKALQLEDDGDEIQFLEVIWKSSPKTPTTPTLHSTKKPATTSTTQPSKKTGSKKEKSAEITVDVSPSILAVLQPHQIEGFKFMYRNCFMNPERGCILAHSVGLGKTLQTITLIHNVLTSKKIDYALILCPKSVLQNWLEEFQKWTSKASRINIHPLFEMGSSPCERFHKLKDWKHKKGVAILNYDIYLQLVKEQESDSKIKKIVKSAYDTEKRNRSEFPFNDVIKSEYVHNMIMETREIENFKVCSETAIEKVRQLLFQVFVDFAIKDFFNIIDIVICDEGHILKNNETKISAAVKKIKTARKIILTGTPIQNNLREFYELVDMIKPGFLGDLQDYKNLFVKPIEEGLLAASRTIPAKNKEEACKSLERTVRNFVHRCNKSNITLPEKHEFVVSIKLSATQEKSYSTFLSKSNLSNKKTFSNYHESVKLCSQPGSGDDMSGKVTVLNEILKECNKRKEKTLIFSRYLESLTMIEKSILNHWTKDEDYFRLDGKLSYLKRHECCKIFNDESSRAKVMLIQTKAGGTGINLYGANHVVIFDPSFNPSDDHQCIGRAHRFGQTRTCYVYRFCTHQTMEEKVLLRQIWKTQLSSKVIDNKKPADLYKSITNLYAYNPQKTTNLDKLKFNKKSILNKIILNCKTILQDIYIFKPNIEDEILDKK